MVMAGGKMVFCDLIGNYGRTPVDQCVLSEESKALAAKWGPCLTLVGIPTLDPGSGKVTLELTKIFSQPVLHEREKTTLNQDALFPKVRP